LCNIKHRNLRIRPIVTKFCKTYFRTFPKSSPPLRNAPLKNAGSALFAGNLALCCNTLKYKGRLVLPTVALAQTSTASVLTFLTARKEVEDADLEDFDENDAREDNLLTARGSLWYLLTALPVLVNLFKGCKSKWRSECFTSR
jgi:hypothetical protein